MPRQRRLDGESGEQATRRLVQAALLIANELLLQSPRIAAAARRGRQAALKGAWAYAPCEIAE